MSNKGQKTRLKRIFVSDVDNYSSKNIAKFLSACEAQVEAEEAEETPPSPRRREPVYQVVGTISAKDEKLRFLHEQYTSPTRDELLKCLLECDVVVYNISESLTQQQVDEATWAVTALHDEIKNIKSRKMFILVSSVMARAKANPSEPDDPESLTFEREFEQRRPHPKFKTHNNLEKLVLSLTKTKKTKLRCYIVAAGLQYGMGEHLFHYFFKTSWLMQVPQVPIFGNGNNFIPMIHVCDLGGVIQNLIELRPNSMYILAVDNSKSTLEEIIKAISDVLGPEKLHRLSLQDAVTMKAFKPEELDCLSLNLRLRASFVNETLNLNWTCKTGMISNMEAVVQEYRDTRQLLPVKICLVGPPAVGKTTLAMKLCQHYKIHHININEIIKEKMTQLKKVTGDDPETGSDEKAGAAYEQLENISKSLEENQGQLTEDQIFNILEEKLNSKPCKNHGFVLDGFLKTYEQAERIFSDEEPERQDSGLMFKTPSYNKIITPEYVFALDASDDFLTKRVQGLPNSVAMEMRYTQDEFVPRLARYRQLSSAEKTLMDFFDHREIHPLHIEVSTDDLKYTEIMKKITEIVGVPKNYGLSPEEQEEENRRREEETKQKLVAEAAERKLRKETLLAEMAAQYKEWQGNLSAVERQECELMESQAYPLRNFLMKHVIPYVIQSTSELCRFKPDDPVDFVAEHLLRSNKQK